jgi:hypothetical protein
MTKLTDSELWDALEEDALDDEMEAVLAKTPEERRRDLREAGFDLDKVHAQADALVAEPTRPAKVVALRPWRRRLAIALPTAVALAAGIALVMNLSGPEVVGHGRDDPPAVRAEALRREARDACGARNWPICLDRLNQARALDARGDEAPEIQALRRSAGDPAAHP